MDTSRRILSFTFIAITQQLVGFIQQVLLLDTIESLIPAALAMLCSTMIFFYLWISAIHYLGKKRSLMIGLILLGLLTPLTPVLRGVGEVIGFITVAILFFVPLEAGIAIYYLMSYVVPSDIAQVDEILSGESRAGIFTGFIGVPFNVFQAASSLLLGWFMSFSEQLTGSELAGLMWWGPVFAPFLLIAAFILQYTNIDPNFNNVRKKVQ
jgi:GPH family glycoside/pentoside/hexuronide:cation symporter